MMQSPTLSKLISEWRASASFSNGLAENAKESKNVESFIFLATYAAICEKFAAELETSVDSIVNEAIEPYCQALEKTYVDFSHMDSYNYGVHLMRRDIDMILNSIMENRKIK